MTKTYDKIKFFVGETEGIEGLDLTDEVTGSTFDGLNFYFSSIDEDKNITLHKISIDK
jgi:hypothetical protein